MEDESAAAPSPPSAASSPGGAAGFPGAERSRILREGVWNAAGQVASIAGRLVGTRVLTELVSPGVYGEANLLVGLATLGSNLFCAPLLHATLRFYPDAERDARVVSLRRLLTRLLRLAATVVVVLILSGGVVWSVATKGSLPFACFLVLAAFFAFDTARLFETNLLNAARRQSTFSLWSIADAWAKPIAAATVIALIAPTTLGMLSGYAVGTGAVLLLFRRTSVGRADGKETSRGDPWSASLRSNVLGYAAPMLPLAILGWTSNLGDRYILAAFSGASAAGLYAAAYGLACQPFLMLSGIMGLTLRPVLFESVAQGDHARERRTVLVWLAAVSLCSFAGVVAIWFCAEPLVGLLLGNEFQGAAPLWSGSPPHTRCRASSRSSRRCCMRNGARKAWWRRRRSPPPSGCCSTSC